MTTFTALPDNYEEALFYPLSSRRMLLMLNMAALAPLVLFGAGMSAYWVWYESIGAPFTLTSLAVRLLPADWDMWALLLMLVLTFPLHEACHGLAFKLLGVEKVKYGVIPRRLVFYAKPSGEAYFYRDGFILAALMPLLLITLGGVVLVPLAPPGLRLGLLLAVAMNAGGAVGDIWTVIVILLKRFPSNALARDLGDTFVVYTPISKG